MVTSLAHKVFQCYHREVLKRFVMSHGNYQFFFFFSSWGGARAPCAPPPAYATAYARVTRGHSTEELSI
jgi:hypothetical protein